MAAEGLIPENWRGHTRHQEEMAGLDEEQILLESMGYDLSVICGEELEKMRR